MTALPPDNHVHTEWSWDTSTGSMERSCARAAELGLPAIAFTEHLDHTALTLGPDNPWGLSAGVMTPPAFDVEGYLESVERCRARYPDLRILSGLETGEPHWYAEAIGKILAAGTFDRVLGSLHCLRDGDGFAEPWGLYDHRDPAEVVRTYLGEVVELVNGSDVFSVLAHIDYPVRSYPGPFEPEFFEEEFRHALRALAGSGRALEINTRLPLSPVILRWWHEEGGPAVSFGSDAHEPTLIARGFAEAAAMAEAFGFRAGRLPYELWGRSG